MTKYIISGAAGFIGYHLAKSLASESTNEVICVDNFVRGEPDAAYERLAKLDNVTALNLDLSDQQAVATLPDTDVVLHLAALNGTQNFYERPFDVVRHCTLPTMFLLDRYAKPGLARFVYAGTSEAYASIVTRFGWKVPTGEDVPVGLDDVTNPRWSYAASKMHGEIATINACRSAGVPWSVIRFHNVYGPRMGDKHVIPDFYIRARQGRFELYGHEDTRAFIFIDDAVVATRLIAETPACAGEIINLGGELEINIGDLGLKMMAAGGFDGNITLHPSPAGSVKRRAPDLAKIRRLTGFKEDWSLEAGLRETAKFYLNP